MYSEWLPGSLNMFTRVTLASNKCNVNVNGNSIKNDLVCGLLDKMDGYQYTAIEVKYRVALYPERTI